MPRNGELRTLVARVKVDKTMKIYVASSFELKEEAQRVAKALESQGYFITREWWKRDYKLIQVPDEEWYERSDILDVARANYAAIDDADVLVLVCPNDTPHKFTGANIEVGYAVARNKRVMAVGKLQRSAMYVPVERYDSLKNLLDGIKAGTKNNPSTQPVASEYDSRTR